MKVYEYGSWDAPVILLLPGTCCHWKKNFGAVIPLLEDYFHVVCISYDGFDENESSVFPDMISEAEKIENLIIQGWGGHIAAAYGCSLVGSLVGLLVQRKRIRIDHAILGSSDLDQETGLSARLKSWIVACVLYRILQKGQLPRWMQKRLDSKTPEDRAVLEKMLSMMGLLDGSMRYVQKSSICNQFYSDLTTPLENGIHVPGTTVRCMYARKMGEQYLARYQAHFASPDIVPDDLQHEQLLLQYPEKWVAEIRRMVFRQGSGK